MFCKLCPKKMVFDISSELSPKSTIFMKCLTLPSEENKKLSLISYLLKLPRV